MVLQARGDLGGRVDFQCADHEKRFLSSRISVPSSILHADYSAPPASVEVLSSN
jgi:hypothetical protein